jgi:hypothetical protein
LLKPQYWEKEKGEGGRSSSVIVKTTSFLSLEGVNHWAGGVAQVEECLTNKCEALNSNPSMAKNKKKERPNSHTHIAHIGWH